MYTVSLISIRRALLIAPIVGALLLSACGGAASEQEPVPKTPPALGTPQAKETPPAVITPVATPKAEETPQVEKTPTPEGKEGATPTPSRS